MTTIVLADDHEIVREGLRSLLEAEPNCIIIGEATDGLATVALVERKRPDVLVLDLIMSGLNGLEVIRQVNQRSPQTRVLVLSMHADQAYVLEALRNGAVGYILKESSSAVIKDAVQSVAAGRRYLAQPLSEQILEDYVARIRASRPEDPYEMLTNREREVLLLIAEGYTVKEVADRLSLSRRTVELHRSNAMRKLGLQNQTELVRYALRRGLISLEK
jgi:DNA-binding NarL/FixJ family response regulator